MTAGGGDGRFSRGEVLPRVSGLLVPTSRFNAELGSQENGQRSRRNTGGGELRRWTNPHPWQCQVKSGVPKNGS
jgi:hypothetical protein